MYPTTGIDLDWQARYRRGFDWREGNTNWTIDYPRSDRHLASAVRRLTRIHARSVEQPINLDGDDDDVFNYPWLYAVEVGPLGIDRRAGRQIPRISAARRILHVRRFPRRQRVGSLPLHHAEGLSGSPDCRYSR